jgi:hypothetical protein
VTAADEPFALLSAAAGGVAGRSEAAGGVAGRSDAAGGVAGRSGAGAGACAKAAESIRPLAAVVISNFFNIMASV